MWYKQQDALDACTLQVKCKSMISTFKYPALITQSVDKAKGKKWVSFNCNTEEQILHYYRRSESGESDCALFLAKKWGELSGISWWKLLNSKTVGEFFYSLETCMGSKNPLWYTDDKAVKHTHLFLFYEENILAYVI